MLVAAGGTAGHLAPALAVADVLRSRGHHVIFATSSGRSDEQIVPARGYELHTFAISGLPRRFGIGQLAAVVRAVAAVGRCFAIIGRVQPDVVLGGGGFVSAPAAIAAWVRRLPVIITEADAHLGLANRLAARFSRRLCSAYPLADFRHKQTVTGRPIEPTFVQATASEARAKLGVPDDARVIVAVGGSGGATHLNEAVHGAWGADPDPRVGELPLHVLHVTGTRDHELFQAMGVASGRYRLLAYSDDMATLLAAADLVVSRAGGSVFELAAVGRASILVPFPHATGDHQRRNARHFADRQAALLLDDDACTPARLRELATELLEPAGDPRRLAMAQAMRGLAKPDAAIDVADIVLQAGAAQARRRAGRARRRAGRARRRAGRAQA